MDDSGEPRQTTQVIPRATHCVACGGPLHQATRCCVDPSCQLGYDHAPSRGDFLLDEPALFAQPRLVRRVGMLEAVLLQRIHELTESNARMHGGHFWTPRTYADWQDDIGCSAKSARYALDKLRREGFVIAIRNPEDARDRTLWWRVAHARVRDEVGA